MAEYLGISERTVRDRIKEHGGYTIQDGEVVKKHHAGVRGRQKIRHPRTRTDIRVVAGKTESADFPAKEQMFAMLRGRHFSDIPAKVKGVRGRLKFRHPRWRRGTIPLKGDK